MKVKCEYCGNYMEDTLEKCPACGAANANHQRAANDTPRTIEDLKRWYQARNLPDPEITRFFIGVNYTKPKAFGIYQEGSEFIVYKNKADGQRAIRYKGTDEAYAVNELYLKLKEEIIRQKNLNAERVNNTTTGTTPPPPRRKTKTARMKAFFITIIIMVSCCCMTGVLAIFGTFINAHSPKEESYYYNSSTDELYYCYEENFSDSRYEWWKYDFREKSWSSFRVKKFPDNISPENLTALKDLQERDPSRFAGIDIKKDWNYIDSGHHKLPSGNSYYVYDRDVYYYLDDTHSSFGDKNNSGWYRYDDDEREWVYYCDSNDKDTLGSGLWYEADSYRTGSSYRDFYELTEDEKNSWVTDFKDTDFYASYTENEQAYTDYQDSHQNKSSYNSYDNDNSYNWDSGSSWDSGGGNWDSDW